VNGLPEVDPSSQYQTITVIDDDAAFVVMRFSTGSIAENSGSVVVTLYTS